MRKSELINSSIKCIEISDRYLYLIEIRNKSFLKSHKNIFENIIQNKVVIALSGEFNVGESKLKKHSIFWMRDSLEFSSNSDTLIFLCVSIQSTKEMPTNNLLFPKVKLAFYEKYFAKIGEVDTIVNNINLINPWSLYFARLNYTPKVNLHVHYNLRNILVFLGPKNKEIGFIIIKSQKSVSAYPLRCGDIAIVESGIIHNVCSKENESMEFYVINDVQSRYENIETSDYHNLVTIDYKELNFEKRNSPESIIYRF
jgi:hypothetical protein